MFKNKFYIILILSFAASFITAFCFVTTLDNEFRLDYLLLPMVLEVACIVAIINGLLFSPIAYWCLKNENLLIIFPLLCILLIITQFFTVIMGIEGLFRLLLIYIYWISALLSIKYKRECFPFIPFTNSVT